MGLRRDARPQRSHLARDNRLCNGMGSIMGPSGVKFTDNIMHLTKATLYILWMEIHQTVIFPDSKVHGANMGPT